MDITAKSQCSVTIKDHKGNFGVNPITAWKVSKYGVISGPYFLVYSPNTGKYGPQVVFGHFSHSEYQNAL